MIIDLKRYIDLRWLFDPVLSFILRRSCFLLQLNPLYMRRIWHLVSRIMKNRYMVRVYKYNWRWEIMSSVFFHGLHYSSLPYIQSREGGCMHQSQPGSNLPSIFHTLLSFFTKIVRGLSAPPEVFLLASLARRLPPCLTFAQWEPCPGKQYLIQVSKHNTTVTCRFASFPQYFRVLV